MPHDFIPRPDADFLLWIRNFVTQLQNDPAGYQTPADVVQRLAMLAEDFATAYSAITRATKCPALTLRKKQTRREAENFARKVAAVVCATRDMTVQLRSRAGLSLQGRGGYRPRRKRVDAAPRVMVRQVQGPVVTVWLIDRTNNRHTRPGRGTTAALFVAVGEHLTGGERWQFVGAGSVTKTIDLSKLKLPPGTRVWLAACWRNRHGAGPMCEPVPARVGDGMVMPRLAA